MIISATIMTMAKFGFLGLLSYVVLLTALNWRHDREIESFYDRERHAH